MLDELLTVKEIIDRGKNFLLQKGVDSPRLTMELLIGSVLKCNRVDLYLQYDRPLSNSELQQLRELVSRRAKREPLQYLLGVVEFCGLQLFVDNATLIPRPETELMADVAVKSLNSKTSGNILDIGCGSGCISLAMAAALPDWNIVGVDISESALDAAKKNKQALSLENVNFFCSDILIEKPQKQYDVVISNPPYISAKEFSLLEPEVALYEPTVALTDNFDGYTFYRRFAELFPEIIAPDNGMFFLEVGFDQSKTVISTIGEQLWNITVASDFNNIERIVCGTRKSQ